tara:strand:+ start:2738 stop:3370 length:633 start_codon:yes stop_codon:yes gene_type:complete
VEIEDFEAMLIPQDEPSRDYVRISPAYLAIWELNRLAEVITLVGEDQRRWIDCIRALHLALVSALTEALSGSANIGALEPKKRGRAIDALNSGKLEDIPDGPIMNLADLMNTARSDEGFPWDDRLRLSVHEEEAFDCLVELRNAIDHPKATLRSEPVSNFALVVQGVTPIVLRVLAAVWHRYESDDLERTKEQVDAILETATEVLDSYRE